MADFASKRRAFVCGWPIEQSRSPLIHGFWLKQLGISGSYEKIACKAEDFVDFLKSMEKNGFIGGNVTIPHKEAAFALVDECDAAAKSIGAVNTVWIDDGKLIGANTDGVGFFANLDERVDGWQGQKNKAVILGAGGAARPITYGIKERGFKTIVVANRTIERAKNLARDFGDPLIACALDEIEDHLSDADILINTTSIGMNSDVSPVSNISALPAHAVVSDIVYSPLETQLLQMAKERGLRTVDGLGMLLHQAVPGFEKWFGQRPEVTSELRNLIISKMTKNNDKNSENTRFKGKTVVILALTGSIGMGKSTTAEFFRELDIPVHDADATVHALYEGEAVVPIGEVFPSAIKDGRVDRESLGKIVVGNKAQMERLEKIVHPLVRKAEEAFIASHVAAGTDLVVLDIPLLFETGGDKRVDGVIVVTAPEAIQRERVLARSGMSEEKFLSILKRQTPDSEKRAKADFLIDTSLGFDHARSEVKKILETIASKQWTPKK